MVKVLVVDDDFMVARVHCGFVERTPGFTVAGVAHSGAEALDAVRKLQPDLVLLDIYLPDLNGIEVLRRLRDESPEVDVLVITAARETGTIRRALRGGVVNYLVKPFGYDALRERLEHYAAAHRSLVGEKTADQTEIDRVFGTHTKAEYLPKGLSSETAETVARALREADGSLSAAECAAMVGISRVSARRYLEHFITEGKAEVRLRYGSAGRPERRYKWLRPIEHS